jgi:hypothetical protein
MTPRRYDHPRTHARCGADPVPTHRASSRRSRAAQGHAGCRHRVPGAWPFVQRKLVPGRTGRRAVEDDLGVQEGGIHVSDQLATAPAGRHHIERSVLGSPDGDDLGDPVLAHRAHRRDAECSAQKPVPLPVSMHTPEKSVPRSVTSVAATSPKRRSPTRLGVEVSSSGLDELARRRVTHETETRDQPSTGRDRAGVAGSPAARYSPRYPDRLCIARRDTLTAWLKRFLYALTTQPCAPSPSSKRPG